jgi:hypothetical protein
MSASNVVAAVEQFFKTTNGFNGFTMAGCYNLPDEILYTAMRTFLETGVNPLNEYHDLILASWPTPDDVYIPLPEIEYLRELLNGGGFWDIDEILSAEDQSAMVAMLDRAERNYFSVLRRKAQKYLDTARKEDTIVIVNTPSTPVSVRYDRATRMYSVRGHDFSKDGPAGEIKDVLATLTQGV